MLTNQTSFILGAAVASILYLGLTLRFMKPLSKFLWSLAHGWESFLSTFKLAHKDAPKDLGRRVTDHPFSGDVISALVNMGVNRKKAEKVVEQVQGHQKYESFEEMFRAAINVAGKVGA